MYDTVIESGVPVKLLGLITLCLSENLLEAPAVQTFVTVLIKNELKQRAALS